MKKIIVSLGIVGVVAVVVIGGTIAYFNDTETSTGNIFTAGSIDLTVDHLAQTYNGADCKTCSVEIKSDTTNEVVGTVNGSDPVSFPHNAIPVTATWVTDAYWTNAIPGAIWVWSTDPVTQHDVDNTVTYSFEKDFVWHGPVAGASMTLEVAADNNYVVYLNGTQIAIDNSGGNSASVDNIPSANISPYILQGANTLRIDVTNLAQPQLPAVNNPGGLLYSLIINGDCEGDYFKTHCTLFGEKNLEAGDYFFNFEDIKPGDYGTNLISLHVDDNDAYTCLIVHDGDDQENIILDPETEYGDLPGVGNPAGDGELSNYLNIFAWEDIDADGMYEPIGETPIYEGLIQTQLIPLALAGGGPTEYIGLAWCAGDISADHSTGVITCDGNGMKDDAQSDSFTAKVTAYAEQQRNNSGFDCANVNLNLE